MTVRELEQDVTNDDGPADGDQLLRRAQKLALGFADQGLTQTEEMLRRVSPEGRAQARRERGARVRRRNRLLGQVALAALASLFVLVALAQFTPPVVSILAAAAVMVLLTALILLRAPARSPGREALVGADLRSLPAEASVWLAAQRRALPGPAVQLTDTLCRRLDELVPQLARLDAREPAADAVRKLVATELPSLIEGWRGVPISLRSVEQSNGLTPSAQLVEGLTLIDAEVTRMTEQLARGALDDVATQGRYLELKYRGNGGLGG